MSLGHSGMIGDENFLRWTLGQADYVLHEAFLRTTTEQMADL